MSSCNPEETPIALAGMRQAGVDVTTSECLAFRLMGRCYKWVLHQPSVTRISSGDASEAEFKEFIGIVKEENTAISTSLKELLGRRGETEALRSSL